jgi:hypothetical protein
MSSYYGVIFPEFWTGTTGRELRRQGGKDAQILGLYLASNRHANMIGLYRLLVDDVKHETGLSVTAIARSYSVLQKAGFAIFDTVSSFVWVYQMARFRLGLKNGATLDAEDKRVPAVNGLYHALEGNPFLGDFYDQNRSALKLKKRRDAIGLVVALTTPTISRPLQGASKGLARGL